MDSYEERMAAMFPTTAPAETPGSGVGQGSYEERMSKLFEVPAEEYAQRSAKAGLSVGRSVQEQADILKQNGFSPEAVKSLGQQYTLEQTKQNLGRFPGQKETILGSVGRQFVEHGIPFRSWAINPEKDVADAQKRLQEGNPTEADYTTIARTQRRQEESQGLQQAGIAGEVIGGLRSAPAIVTEFMAGGALAKGLGVGQAARVSLGGQLASNAGRMAAITPFVPSMYMEQARQKNIENGRPPDSWEGLPPALLHSYAQMLVLGQVFRGAATPGLAAGVKSALGKGATGAVEMGLADSATNFADNFIPQAYKISTGHGTFEQLMKGDVGPGLRKFAVDALTLSAFAGLHSIADGVEMREANKTALINLEAAAKDMTMLKSVTKSSQEASTHAADLLRNLGQKIATGEPITGEETVAGRPSKLAEAMKTPEPEVPNDAFSHVSDADLIDLAKFSGVTVPKGKKLTRKGAVAGLLEKGIKPSAIPGGEAPGVAPANGPAPPAETPSAPPIVDSGASGASEKPTDGAGGRELTPMEQYLASRAGTGLGEVPKTVTEGVKPLQPHERLYRVPDSKNLGNPDNVGAAIKELEGGQFKGKFTSRKFEGNDYPGHVQFEFRADRLEPEHTTARVEDAIIGGTAPMKLHPSLAAIRYRGSVESESFRSLKETIDKANIERAAKGIDPIELHTGKAAKRGPKPEPETFSLADYADAMPDTPGKISARRSAQEAVDKAMAEATDENVRAAGAAVRELRHEIRQRFPNLTPDQVQEVTNRMVPGYHRLISAKQVPGGEQPPPMASMGRGGRGLGEEGRTIPEGEFPEPPQADAEMPDAFGKPMTGAEKQTGLPGGGQPDAAGAEPPLREFGLKEAETERLRNENRFPPIVKGEPVADPVAWGEMLDTMARDSNADTALINDLTNKMRATTQPENLLLLHRRIALDTELRRAAGQMMLGVAQRMKGEITRAEEDARFARVETIQAEIDRLDHIIDKTGTETGRSLRARRLMAREDYSLSTMMARAQNAKGEEPLSREEQAEIAALSKRIEDLTKQLDESKSGTPAAKAEESKIRVEIKETQKEFAEKLDEFRWKNLPPLSKVRRVLGESLDFSRALRTAFDLSAGLRQGAIFALGHPIRFAREVLPQGLKAFKSEKEFQTQLDSILQRDNAVNYKRDGLPIMDSEGPITVQEEAFIGRWVDWKPPTLALRGLLEGVKASGRAYSSMLNRIRADHYDMLAATLSKTGKPTAEEGAAIANAVSVFSGRAKLTGSAEKAASLLTKLFFAPRFVASRFQLLAGQPLYGGTSRTRAAIAKEYGRALLGLGGLYLLAGLDDDAKITFDPRSSDFGKIRFGNTRLDPLAGLSQTAVFVTRLVTGEKETAKGKLAPLTTQNRLEAKGKIPYGGDKVGDVVKNFLRSKLAPIPAAIWNAREGENVVGDQTTIASTVGSLTAPMAVGDVYKSLEDQGVPRGAALGLLAILGMGSQTYEPKKPGKKETTLEQFLR